MVTVMKLMANQLASTTTATWEENQSNGKSKQLKTQYEQPHSNKQQLNTTSCFMCCQRYPKQRIIKILKKIDDTKFSNTLRPECFYQLNSLALFLSNSFIALQFCLNPFVSYATFLALHTVCSAVLPSSQHVLNKVGALSDFSGSGFSFLPLFVQLCFGIAGWAPCHWRPLTIWCTSTLSACHQQS